MTSKCRHCSKDKVFAHKNPTGLWKHLKRNHPAVYARVWKADEDEKKRIYEDMKKKEFPVEKGKSSKGKKTSAEALFGPMDQFANKTAASKKKNSLPTWKVERITKRFAFWMAGSSLPISAVTKDENFHLFIEEIDESLSLPQRYKVMQECTKISREVKTRIMESLGNARKVSLTTDIWTSKDCKNSYLG